MGGIRDHSPGIWDHNPWDRDQQCLHGIRDHSVLHNNKNPIKIPKRTFQPLIWDFQICSAIFSSDNNGGDRPTQLLSTCNSQFRFGSNVSFRDLPLLYETIGGSLNISLSRSCC